MYFVISVSLSRVLADAGLTAGLTAYCSYISKYLFLLLLILDNIYVYVLMLCTETFVKLRLKFLHVTLIIILL